MAQVAYERTYQLIVARPGSRSFKVTFPYEVVEREARRRGLSIPDFIQHFQVVAQFGNSDEVSYRFVEITS